MKHFFTNIELTLYAIAFSAGVSYLLYCLIFIPTTHSIVTKITGVDVSDVRAHQLEKQSADIRADTMQPAGNTSAKVLLGASRSGGRSPLLSAPLIDPNNPPGGPLR